MWSPGWNQQDPGSQEHVSTLLLNSSFPPLFILFPLLLHLLLSLSQLEEQEAVCHTALFRTVVWTPVGPTIGVKSSLESRSEILLLLLNSRLLAAFVGAAGHLTHCRTS